MNWHLDISVGVSLNPEATINVRTKDGDHDVYAYLTHRQAWHLAAKLVSVSIRLQTQIMRSRAKHLLTMKP